MTGAHGDSTTRGSDGLAMLAAQSRAARTTVLPAKLRPPVTPAYLVPRPRLHQLVDEAVAGPLTLVVAPAGSGKTSLLSGWVAQTATTYAWLSLDEADRDPVQLWRGILAALEGIAPGSAATCADLIRRRGGLPKGIAALLDDLESRSYDDRVLIIDDVQLVDEDEAVVASLSLFLQHLPPWLHVVVASRREPRLPVHRLRARGQLGEVHFAELRFSFDEAAAMLARLIPDLDPYDLDEIATAAGGWAASIQLAALAQRSARARGGRVLPATGDRHYLEDYVWNEILASESEELVDVLLATSVVERIDPGLALILASRPDAVDLLTLAQARGLFVNQVEPSGHFEVHRLVREVLLSILSRRSPDRLPQLHAWAAGWHEAHGEVVSALEHWLRAGRPHDAIRLVAAEGASLYDGGHESTIRRTIEAIPDSVASSDVQTMIEFTISNLLVDRRRFVSLVESLGRRVRDDLDLDAVQGARIEVLQSMATTLCGNWADGGALARSALQTFGETWWLDPVGQFSWNMVARDIALSERWDESGPESRRVVRALGIAPDRRIAFEGTRALAEALAGRPVDALRVAAGARRTFEVANRTILRTEVLAAEAVAHRELGEPDAALVALLELCEEPVEAAAHCQLLAGLELTRVRLDEGNTAAARIAFTRSAELVETEMPGPGARTWLARTGTVLELACGELDDARRWAAQVVDPFWSGITTARVLLSTGDAAAAGDALKTAEPRNLRHRVLHDLLQSRATADPCESERCLLDAVRLASTHGLIQTIASEGGDVVEAVERLAWQAPPMWLGRLRRACASGYGPGSPGVAAHVESLTDRELEVLRMLPSRLTLREIADELFISINTLKFHLKVIYHKLGCGSRAEAADVARSLAGLRHSTQPPSTRRR
ncbi:LuxR C-terminal-related transcriptional regulator [Nocardioides sp. CN2-186]|uniref:helix-turn-helix transcriptional regulator n=1 Tax=Nocardioides tweenelious TaxID=3156607 RepID=UPI0032B405F9